MDLDVLSGPMVQSGAEDCFSRPRVNGDLLSGAFEAWPSIMWTVLSGPDVISVDQWLWKYY